MKDLHDHQTADLLPEKRPRGRPRTGAAKTGAERQRAYRKQSRARDRANLNVMISVEARVSLDALARHHGCSLAEVLEPLLICLLYTSPSPRDQRGSRMPSSA